MPPAVDVHDLRKQFGSVVARGTLPELTTGRSLEEVYFDLTRRAAS